MKILLRKSVATIAIIVVAGCTGVPAPSDISGKVLEADTYKPVKGAIVVEIWEGDLNVGFVDSQSTCYHVETATTDAEGNYYIDTSIEDEPEVGIFNGGGTIYVYKKGYEESDQTLKKQTYKHNLYLMEKFKGDEKARIGYLKSFVRATNCSDAGATGKNLLPAYEAIYNEILSTNATQKDKDWVLTMMAYAATDGYGNLSDKNYRLKMREFIKEHRVK